MITCTSCGKPNGDYAVTCTSCGVHLWNESGPSQGRARDYAEPTYAPTPPQWPAYTPPVQAQPIMVQPHQFSGFQCPYCRSTETPFMAEKITTAGWVTFGVLLFFCPPMFWIGLMMKEVYRQCRGCAMRLG